MLAFAPGLQDKFDGASRVSRVLRLRIELSAVMIVDQNSPVRSTGLSRGAEDQGFKQGVFFPDSITGLAFHHCSCRLVG
jgi:hypothetical protein